MNNDPLMESLLSQLTEQLQARSFMIATAESCTGGLVAALLTECPGSSNWFERGFVTYSNLAKQESLGVDEQLIQNFGAVSIPVAEAMAAGALNHSQADIALAVTGIAGPAGGSVEKPVGTVCFAFARRGFKPQAHTCLFPRDSRQQIRHLACIEALRGVITLLNQRP